MKIVHISAELAPIAKVGGLADALFGLAKNLVHLGHDVEIILPKYDTLKISEIKDLHQTSDDLSSFFKGRWFQTHIWKGKVHGLNVTFIDPKEPLNFFKRGKVYGDVDDPERFAFFSRAALEYLHRNDPPDIIHLHDWHASLVAPLYKIHFGGHGKVVLTLHNMAYRGITSAQLLEKIGLETDELFEDSGGRTINILRGGIVYSDFVTTVSPTYAKELLEKKDYDNLCYLLSRHAFKGILNGIDYNYWNPESDPHLPYHFSSGSLEMKKKLAQLVRKKFSLEDEDSPLVCCITRLVHQKGPELIKSAILRTLEGGGQFVLIGATSDEETQERFSNLKKKLSSSHHVYIDLTYNEELAHLVYAASDLFLVPSIFEPCGLTQLISMRYGALPLVRRTGGLADTVFDGENGFTFDDPTAEAISKTVDRALKLWFEDQGEWKKMMQEAMTRDYSWQTPAEEYLQVYNRLLS